jgi:MFS superfamily sulfate permease-like transporter
MLIRTLRKLAVPNIRLVTAYRSKNLRPDLVAGLSVAAVQIPTAIAYAPLAGFPPIVGLYASILLSVIYALFGSSRQLMIGPEAASVRIKLVLEPIDRVLEVLGGVIMVLTFTSALNVSRAGEADVHEMLIGSLAATSPGSY